MIKLRLFKSNETNFKHCKWVLSECLSAYITETTDGNFELDVEYPLFDKKNLSKELVRGNIISSVCYDSRPNQLFKIRKVTKNTDETKVIVYAECIGRTDAGSNYIPGVEIQAGKTRKEAMQILLDNRSDKRRNYTIGNLDMSTNTDINLGLEDETGNVINYVDIADKSLLKAILEESTDKTNSSIYTAYNGEIIWNNFEINMVDERGKDNSFVIKSGKNLESLEEEISDIDDDFATALIMKSNDGLFLPNQEIIYSPNADKYDRYFYKTITCDVSLEDLITENSTESDIEEAKQIVYAQLREKAQQLFNNGIDKPPANYTVNFLMLKDVEEYKDYALLEKCELGNNVTTIYSKIGVRAEGRVISIKYNVLTDKIEEVEIGDRQKKSIVDTINNTENTANEAKKEVTETKNKLNKTRKELDIKIDETADGIILSVTNLETNVTAKFEVLDGKIESKVDEDDFGTLIEQNSRSVITTIHGESDNKVIIDSDGLTVIDGGFTYENTNGDTIIEATANGMRIGDPTWSKSISMDRIYLGKLPFSNYFLLSNIEVEADLDLGDYDAYGNRLEFTRAYINRKLTCESLSVEGGTKSCLQHTEHYGKRLISAYETAEYYFGDIGSGKIKDGECICSIEPIFQECVNTDIEYHVFTNCYFGKISKIERYPNYFIVYGENNTEFSWEIKAKRKGFENNRLQQELED